MRTSTFLAAFCNAALISQTAAFFRVTCAPWKRERLDPLVNPGVEGSHMHTFWGSRKITPDSITGVDFQDGCTSCDNQLDKSAYWMPTLYYVKRNATVPVKVGIFHVYYQGQENSPGEYPDDFALIGGNPKITEDEIRDQGGNGIKWHFEESDEVKEDWELPKKRGTGWLRGNVPFPGWVVKDNSLGRYRACNDTIDTSCISVPGMFFAVWYDVSDAEFFTFENGDYLTLSSGGGHTYHGDFIMGWDKSVRWEVSNNVTEFAKIGGDEAYILNATCNATAESTTYLWDLDYQSMLAAKNGSARTSVVTGTYNNFLLVSDGRSINATWNGEYANADIPVKDKAKTLSASFPSSTTSTASNIFLGGDHSNDISIGTTTSSLTSIIPSQDLTSTSVTRTITASGTAASFVSDDDRGEAQGDGNLHLQKSGTKQAQACRAGRLSRGRL